MVECAIIGAGPGGLGVAAELRRRGVRAVVLERGSGPATRWRERYDSLRINTSSLTSFPPGGRFPLRYGRWPTRDQLVEHYERYAAAHGLEIRAGVEVRSVGRDREVWVLRTSAGELRAQNVVVATGKDGRPAIPAWPGRAAFGGELVHAAGYRNADPYRGRRVLVVGAGSSAVDICVDLLGAASSVTLSIRTPPHLVHRAVAGLPGEVIAIAVQRLPRPLIDRMARAARRLEFGDLSPHGLPLPSDGLTARVLDRGMIPTVDPGSFVPAVKRGDIRVVPAVDRLDRDGAVLADGSRAPADAIVAATGYGRGLEPLVGHLGVLDERGHPPPDGRSALPGLHFIGFTDVLTGNLRQLRLDARRIARATDRSVRASRSAASARPRGSAPRPAAQPTRAASATPRS
jgi:putative flavoprotein involved in K+ transport